MKPIKLSDSRLRNLLRGAQANTEPHIRRRTINNARRILDPPEAQKFATLVCQTDLDELYFGPAFPNDVTTIYKTPRRRVISIANECALQTGRLLHYLPRAIEAAAALGTINSTILSGDLFSSCRLCENFMHEFGFSATLARKVIYINFLATSATEIDSNSSYKQDANELLKLFFSEEAPRLYSQFLNLTIDICDRDVDCLETMKEHLRILKKSQKTAETFPPHYAMMRRILFPVNHYSVIDNVALLYFSSSTAVDLLVDLSIASECEPSVPHTLRTLCNDRDFLQAQSNLQPTVESIHTFLSLPHVQGAEQAVYRASAIFPEVSIFARWRRAIDFEFYVRNDTPLPREPETGGFFASELKLTELCEAPSSENLRVTSHFDNSTSGAFLRTVAVLNRIRNGDSLSDISPEEIRILLSQTTGFSRILRKNELIELKERSEREDSHVIVFLAMVMLNEQEPSEDIAFDTRMAFQKVVIQSYDSDIISFLNWLYGRTQSLCPVVVDLCDIAFLERLYLLNASYTEVLSTRERICRWTAEKFERPELVATADRLALDSKVRMIREGIDDTRIFVDVLRYKQWAMDALSPTLRKFERVVSVAPVTITDKHRAVGTSRMDKEAPVASSDFWFYITSEYAFSQFCHNRLFGIDSYLSRRIRHGTLAGTLIVPIQQKLAEFQKIHPNSLNGYDNQEILRVLDRYKTIVSRIRDDLLHFRSKDKPKGLFIPGADQTSTRMHMQRDFRNQIVQYFTDGHSSSDVSPFFLNHCWDLLTEDLLRIQNELRRIFISEVRPLLRGVAEGKREFDEWKSLAADLDQTADGLFSGLNRWFEKSEGSAMLVTVRELVTVVVQEVAGYFPNYEQRYCHEQGGDESLWGLAYQTVYDLLSVFFTNIAQHADPKAETRLSSGFTDWEPSGSAMLNISIVSQNLSGTIDEDVRRSMHEALVNDDDDNSMVREGKSGLGKAKALIRAYSGGGRFSWGVEDGRCHIEFSVPVILVGSRE